MQTEGCRVAHSLQGRSIGGLATRRGATLVQLSRCVETAREGKALLFVSPFVDLGDTSILRSAHADGSGRLLVRSAQRTRGFRIRQPRPEDQDALAWRPPTPGLSLRRFAQFAVIVEPVAAPPAGGFRVDLDTQGDRAPWPALGVAAAILLALPRLASSLPALGTRIGRRWGLALLAILMAATVAMLWQRKWVDSDELDIVGQARKMLVEKRSSPELFNYPPALVYLHAGASLAAGVAGAVNGATAYHDPYTNQLFLHGAPMRFERALGPDDVAIDFFDESTAALRRLYALAGCLLVAAAYALARRIAGERAGIFAGLALAAQPLLLFQSAQILPNVACAAMALLLILGLSERVAGPRRALSLGTLTGVLLAFKYNPVFLLVLLGAIAFDSDSRARKAKGAALGVALGFVLACPPALFDTRRFLSGAAIQAFHYGYAGHVFFEADAPWGAIAHGVYLWWPRYWPVFLVAAASIVGAAGLLAHAVFGERRREAALILATIALSVFFFSRQFVQFGRNYLTVVALAAVLAGLGIDAAIRRTADLSRAGGRALGLAFALCLLVLWSELPLGKGLWSAKRSAREAAIAFVDDAALAGMTVVMVEPPEGLLQGVRPNPRKLRVRSFEREDQVPEALRAAADFVIKGGTERLGFERPAAEQREFSGPDTPGPANSRRSYTSAQMVGAAGMKKAIPAFGLFGPLESRVLDAVWERGRATVADVQAEFRPLAYTTLMTTLDRLYKKGALGRSKEGRAYVYSVAGSRDQVERSCAAGFFERLLGGDPRRVEPLLSSFVDAVSDKDRLLLDELERIVREKRRSAKPGRP
jgi:predicted transcriptional regulator/4-amino-4-deoxy-L-arabinose transferase-like glycosyltransferase